MSCPYKTLGIRKNASAATLRKAYRKLAMENHPDRNVGCDAAKERLAAVQAAYELLNDPERRKRFDATGDTSVGPSPSQKLGELMGVLVPCLTEVLKQLAEQNAKVEEQDVVAQMRHLIGHALGEIEKQKKTVEKMRKSFVAVADRFTVEGEENLLQHAAKAQADLLGKKAANLEQASAAHKAAQEFLKKCKFAHIARAARMTGSMNGWYVTSACV